MSNQPDPRATRATVLVIEDNPISLKMMRLALGSADYRVLEAPDGRSAIELLEQERPDLILQDMNLPDIDGLELVRRLRDHRHGADVPILAISGTTPNEDRLLDYQARFTDYLCKPVAPSHLLAAVDVHLHRQPGSGELAGHDRRLLIVDDDRVQLKLSQRIFTALGFKVMTAADGAEALVKARESPPEAILADVLMPRMDGFRLCYEIRQQPHLADVPVVLSSNAYGGSEDHFLARQVGACALVVRTPDLRGERDALLKGLVEWTGEMGSGTVQMPVERYADRVVQQLERQVQLNHDLARRLALSETKLGFLSAMAEGGWKNLPAKGVVSDLLKGCLNAVGASHGAVHLLQPDGSLALEACFGYPETARDLVSDFFGHSAILRMALADDTPILCSGGRIPGDQAESLCRTAGVPMVCLARIGSAEEKAGVLWIALEVDSKKEDWIAFAQAMAGQFSQAIRLSQEISRTTLAERQFRDLFENAVDGLFQLNLEGGFRMVNPSMARLCGYDSTAELLDGGLGLPQLFTDAARGAEFLRHLDREGMISGFTGQLRRKTGDELCISASGRATRGSDGSVQGYEGRIEDVTLQAKALELAKSEETRKQQLQLKDQFLSQVSHELRTPLTVLHQLTTILLEGLAGQITPEQERMLTVALRNINQLRSMIEDLLDVTRAESGSLAVHVRSISIVEIIPLVLESLKSTADLKSITLSADVKSGLPQAVADPSRVGQILSNLVGNAIKFTPDRGVVTVRARVWPDDPGFLETIVADTGEGVPPEEIDRIFDYLYQGPNAAAITRKGFGIGLYLCKDLVERQGGRIWATSRPGSGSVFSFTLPAAAAGIAGLRSGSEADGQ